MKQSFTKNKVMDKINDVWTKVMLFFLGMNILVTLIYGGDVLIGGESLLISIMLVKIIILAVLFYLVYKKKSGVFYIIVSLSLLSLPSSIKTLSQLQGFSLGLAIYDIVSLIVLIIVSVILIWKSQYEKPSVRETFKNLNNKEVIFWGLGSFILLMLSVLLALFAAFFLPFGTLEQTHVSLLELILQFPSIFPVITILSMIFSVYSVVKKSFMKAYLSSIGMGLLLLLTLNHYQGFVIKPFLSGVNYFAFAALSCLIIFLVGIYVIISALLNKDYFNMSKY
jgi:hypothetical protein